MSAKTKNELTGDTPYAGLLLHDQGDDPFNRNAGRKAGQIAVTAPHLLVGGLTGASKTRSCLAPNVVAWGDRPVVALSSKGDLAELTIRQRARRGTVYLMDLSGEVRESELQGIDVKRVISDPCELVENDDDAFIMATLLTQIGTLGAGGTGDASDESAQWKALATRPLANFIRAAGWIPDPETGQPRWGGGIHWALQAVEDLGDDETPPQGENDDEPVDIETPNWDTVYCRSRMLGSSHAQSLLAAKKKDPRQRDSIGINLQMALTAWALVAVAGDENSTRFNPAMLAEPGATLYIIAGEPASGPAASAVINQLVRHWRRRVGQLPELLMVLDELPNGAPLPELERYVGEARGLGVRIVAAVQASSQFEPRWGSAGLTILRDTFPAVLVYRGVAERDLLEAAAWAGGEEERSTSSTDTKGGSSYAKDRMQVHAGNRLLPPEPGTARLLLGGEAGVLVRLPDIEATNLRA